VGTALAAILLSVNLLLPLGFDNDVYQSMGQDLWKFQRLPYVESWDQNFPGIVYIHALSIGLFGSSDIGFRLLDLVLHIIMAALYALVLRRWLTPQTTLIAVILSVIYYCGGAWGLAGQRDGYALMFLLIASLALFRLLDEDREGKSVGSGATEHFASLGLGVACAAAFLMRPTYALFAMAFCFLLWKQRNSVREIGVILIGFFGLLILALIPYLFVEGGFRQVFLATIRFNLDLYARIAIPISFFTIGRGVFFMLGIVGLVLSLRRTTRNATSVTTRADKLFLMLSAGCATLSIVVMGKYFTYHFEPLMAIVIGFAARGVECMAQYFRIRPLERVIPWLVVLLLGYFLYPRHLLREFSASGYSLHQTYERILSDSLSGLRRQEEVIGYVNLHSKTNEPIEIASFFPSLRWRAGRVSVTRFTTLVPLVSSKSNGSHPTYQREWQQEYVRTLDDARPAFLVLDRTHIWWPFARQFSDEAIHTIPGFDSMLAVDYRPDTVIGGYALYARR
jgi:hypothetical protein